MKRHLNTSYRLVWNHITGTLVVASELARSRGKRTGVAIALSLAAVTSVPALAADTVVQAGETVSGGTLTNHDNQIVLGTANGMTISTGLEYGPDNEANTGGQWIQNGGIANNTTVTGGGLQRVNAGGSVSDTVISAGGGQSLQGQAVNTTLNGGEQWVHEGGIATGTVINEKGWQAVKSGAMATDTVVNTGAEGGPDAENGDTGQFVRGNAVRTTINKNGRQIVAVEGTANTTVVYAGGDQTVHGHALDTTLNGGYQYVHNGGTASDTVVNSDGWQIVKEGGLADFTTVIFGEDRHTSRSKRYAYIPTITVLESLQREGFQPFFACQTRVRDPGRRGYTKHMLRLRRAGEINGEHVPEIILLNSHDGTSSYQMLPGYFRFVCQNGCVCGQSLGEVRVPHRGNVVDRVIEGAYEVVGVFDRIEEKRDAMQSLVLPPPARQALAQAALTYRYGDEHQPVTTADILTPRRREDYGKDLWSAYQTIQENMLKGGISGRSARGKRIHTRAIHSIDTDIKLNRALWVMAETMLESLR